MPRPAEAAASRRRRVALVVAVVVQLAVLYWPRTPDVGGVPGLDLVVHLLVFGAVASTGRRAGVPVVPLLLALVAHAVLSEVVQGYLLAERSGDRRDVVADVVGAAAGLLLGRRPPAVPDRERRASS